MVYKKYNHLINQFMKLCLKTHYKFYFHQQFQCILRLIYQLCCFYTHNCYNPNILHDMSHDLSHSHSQLLGLQINILSHIPLSTNSFHSYQYLSSFHLCLLLQTLALNLHMHLQVSCLIICLVSLILDIRLNTLTFIF